MLDRTAADLSPQSHSGHHLHLQNRLELKKMNSLLSGSLRNVREAIVANYRGNPTMD